MTCQRSLQSVSGTSYDRPRRTCENEIHDAAHAVIPNNIMGDMTVIQFRSYESAALSGDRSVKTYAPIPT